MKNPICPDCNIESRPVITSFADCYEPDAIYDDPRAGMRYPTGEYVCPKCNKLLYPEAKK